MLLYLVRHGEALSADEDPERPLSIEGQTNVKKIAGLLPPNQISAQEVYHSEKLRAEQTAQILQSAFAPMVTPEKLAELDPEADLKPILERLNAADQDLMLVGHIPFMERLASMLLTGKKNKPVIQFSAGMIACLKRNGPSDWTLCWALDPHMINY